MSQYLERLDGLIADAVSGWNIYTTAIAMALASLVAYIIFTARDPDIHPMILARQSAASPVRKPGESAVYRAPDVPHGFPLRSGLNVKDRNSPTYARGRDGDLRDVWRRFTGQIPMPAAGQSVAPPVDAGKLMTVFGQEKVQYHDKHELEREIAMLGSCIGKTGGARVAIYLPNSVEFLQTLFACAFYGLTAILIPYNQPLAVVLSQLEDTHADVLVAQAGSLPLEQVTKHAKAVMQVIWVVEKTSRHMDWTEVPEGLGGKVDVCEWHELLHDGADGDAAVPDLDKSKLGAIVTLWQPRPGDSQYEIVEFTHANMVAAVAGLLAALPSSQRLNSSDLFLAADSLTHSYALCLTLAAMFCQTSIALNSVAGAQIDLTFSASSLSPSVVVASAESASRLHQAVAAQVKGGIPKVAHYLQGRSLESGRMPSTQGTTVAQLYQTSTRETLGSSPGKLRLLFVAERAGADTPPLSSHDLCDLRIFTGARILYALTAAKVAGAVAQTNIFDYRKLAASGVSRHSHFGVPLGCLEVKLTDTDEHKTTDDGGRGEIVVCGPSVAGGEATLGVAGSFGDDHTLAYI